MQFPNYNSQIHFFLKSALLICLISCETTEFHPKLNGSEEDEFIGMMLEKMSIEDKVGQMTQLNLGFLSSSKPHSGFDLCIEWELYWHSNLCVNDQRDCLLYTSPSPRDS